jgi:integrase
MDPMAEAYRPQTAAPACAHTLQQAWKLFLQERSISLSPTSLVTDYAQVTKWLSRCPVEDLRQGRQVLIWVLQQSPILAARRVCMYVRSMYRWAAAEDVALLPSNPVANFRMPKAPQKSGEVTVIPRHEISLVLAALEAKRHHRNVNWSLFAEFMLQTAMRTGEVRAMKWSDLKDGRVLVHSNYTLTHGHKNSTKTNKQRWVPLNPRAQEILDQLDRSTEYVFPWNRLAFQSFFGDRMRELHGAGLIEKKYRPYDLRHVAISRWLEAGIPVTQAANWAGNTSEVVWKHYANTTTEYEMPVL